MGVPGLWDVSVEFLSPFVSFINLTFKILNKAGKSRSLVHLAVVDGFEKNVSRRWVLS